jgi:hypothetical protein
MKNNLTAIKNEKYAWFLFLLLPVLSFIYAVKNFENKKLRKIIVLFGALFGLTFIPIPNSDSTRYAANIQSLINYDFQAYLSDILNITSGNTQFPDVYAFTMFFIATSFTNNPQFFFMLVALVYFWVLIKLVSSFYNPTQIFLKTPYAIFFLAIVFTLNFSAGINGVRWPLGLIVFLYGAYNLFLHNKLKFLFIASLSILIHFSLSLAVGGLILFYFLPYIRSVKFLLIFGLITFSAGTIFSSFIFSNSDFFGDVFTNKLDGYTGEGYVEKRKRSETGWNFYLPVARFGNYYFALFVLLLMTFQQKKLNANTLSKNLFAFSLYMTSFSFVANAVVDLSTNRYKLIVGFFCFAYLMQMCYLNQNNKTLKWLSLIYTPILLLRIFTIIRTDWQSVSLTLLTNPIFEFFI